MEISNSVETLVHFKFKKHTGVCVCVRVCVALCINVPYGLYLTFIGRCIVNIFAEYNQQDVTLHKIYLFL